MGRPCSICTNPLRPEIDRSLVNGGSYRRVAELFGVGPTSVLRHKRDHMPKLLLAAQIENTPVPQVPALREPVEDPRSQEATGQSPLVLAEKVLQQAISLLSQAEAAGDVRAAAQMIRETRACLELLAKAREAGPRRPGAAELEPANSVEHLPERMRMRIRQLAQEIVLDLPFGSLSPVSPALSLEIAGAFGRGTEESPGLEQGSLDAEVIDAELL